MERQGLSPRAALQGVWTVRSGVTFTCFTDFIDAGLVARLACSSELIEENGFYVPDVASKEIFTQFYAIFWRRNIFFKVWLNILRARLGKMLQYRLQAKHAFCMSGKIIFIFPASTNIFRQCTRIAHALLAMIVFFKGVSGNHTVKRCGHFGSTLTVSSR